MSTYTINKRVANERAIDYTTLGWVTDGMTLFPPSPDETMVTIKIPTATGRDENDIWQQKTPYLVQRARIRRPFHEQDGDKLTSAINMDYMGAAEFEFGALPRSLRRIQVQFALYQVFQVPEISILGGRNPLRVYANFDSDRERNQYLEYLKFLRAGTNTFYLHEWTSFDIGSTNFPDGDCVPQGTDFWWDIQNDVMWSFDHRFMEGRLQKHLQTSFSHMNALVVQG